MYWQKILVLTSRWGILLDKNMRQIAKNGFQEHFKMVQKGCSNNSEYLFQKISDTDRFELIILLSVCLGHEFCKTFWLTQRGNCQWEGNNDKLRYSWLKLMRLSPNLSLNLLQHCKILTLTMMILILTRGYKYW